MLPVRRNRTSHTFWTTAGDSIIDPAKAKVLPLPKEIGGFQYIMAWHARAEADAQHWWLRQTIREAAQAINPLPPPG